MSSYFSAIKERMTSKQDAQQLFNQAFDARFKDLQAMFDTPSAVSEDVDMKPSAMKSDTQSCEACKTLTAASPVASSSDGCMSWILLFLLVLGMILVIYGLFMIFRKRREPLHKKHPPNRYSAPHVVAGGAPLTKHETSANADELEEKNPENIMPDASDAQATFLFFHAVWCGHCKQFKPIFEASAKAAKGKAKFKTVVSDVLQQSSHADKFPIRGFPTIIVYVKGEQVDTLVGNQGKDALDQLIMKYAK